MLNALLAFVGGGLQCRIDFYNGITCEDCGEVWVVPWDSYQEQTKAFAVDDTIQGTISIDDSSGTGDAWIQKISLVFTQYVHYLDPYINNDTLTVTVDISSSVPGLPCKLSSLLSPTTLQSQGPILEVPFNFTINDHVKESDRHLIFESYNGTNIGMRHKLEVIIERQWYQFQKTVSLPIYMYKHQQVVSTSLPMCMEIPVRDEIENTAINVAPLETIIEGTDNVNKEDKDNFEVSKLVLSAQTLDLFGPLQGYVQITNIDVPIENIELRLLRRELIGGFCYEEILQIHTLIGEENVRQGELLNSKIPHTRGHVGREDEGEEEQDTKWDADFSPIRSKSIIHFNIPFSTSECHLMSKTMELTAPSISRAMSRTIGGTSMNDDRQYTRDNKSERYGFGDIVLSPSFDVASELGKRPIVHTYGGVFSIPKRGQIYGDSSTQVILPLHKAEIPGEAIMGERSESEREEYEINNVTSLLQPPSAVCQSSTKFHDLEFNDAIAVRYYVRCKVIDTQGKKFWNTKEIQISRISKVVASEYAPLVKDMEIRRSEQMTRYTIV